MRSLELVRDYFFRWKTPQWLRQEDSGQGPWRP